MNTHLQKIIIFAFVILCVLGFSLPGQAQTGLPLDEILKKTEQHYQRLNAYTADFIQWTTSSSTATMTSEASGRLYYQKPRQMCWQYKTPEAQTFVANNRYAWLYVPEERQISLFDAENFFASPLARTFFDGIFELKKHFNVSLDPNESSNAAAVLELSPRKEDPQVKSLRLWIDLRDYNILSVETQDALGNTNRLVIKEQKEVGGLSPELFQLDVPSGTTVVDTDGRELAPPQIETIKRQLRPQQGKK